MTIPKNNQVIIFIFISFILGAVIGYAVNEPERITEIEYINNTIEVPKIVYQDRIVEVTVIATPTPEITVPATADFSIKIYDPSTDPKPSKTIEFTNWRVNPPTLSVKPETSILFKNIDFSLTKPLALIINSTEEKKLSTSGGMVVVFNKRGIYKYEAFVASEDPNIKPLSYGKGTITVY